MNYYEVITKAIWQSGFIPDKNKVRQQAREDMRRLIANNLAGQLKAIEPDFDVNKFMADCQLEAK